MEAARGKQRVRDTGGLWLRLLWLDGELREGRKVTPADLEERFEISRRSALNAVAYLKDSLGAPIVFSRDRRSYVYTNPTYALPSVFLREGELFSLILAEQVARQYLGTPLEAPLRAAIEKLRRYLPQKASVHLAAMAAGFRFSGGSGLEAPLDVLMDLERAVRERRVVRIVYYTASRDDTRERAIEPHFLTNVSGDWTCVAWDRWRNEPREFMAARVREHALLDERFQRRDELTPETYSQHTFKTEHGAAPYEAVLRFDAYQARWIRERTWHASQRLEELPDGGVLLRLTVGGEGDLARWVLGYGSHVEVVAPPWLRERVRDQLESAVQIYRGEVAATATALRLPSPRP